MSYFSSYHTLPQTLEEPLLSVGSVAGYYGGEL